MMRLCLCRLYAFLCPQKGKGKKDKGGEGGEKEIVQRPSKRNEKMTLGQRERARKSKKETKRGQTGPGRMNNNNNNSNNNNTGV